MRRQLNLGFVAPSIHRAEGGNDNRAKMKNDWCACRVAFGWLAAKGLACVCGEDGTFIDSANLAKLQMSYTSSLFMNPRTVVVELRFLRNLENHVKIKNGI